MIEFNYDENISVDEIISLWEDGNHEIICDGDNQIIRVINTEE